MALSTDILNFCVFDMYGHCKKEIDFHTLVGQDGGQNEEERKRENMSISIPNRQTKYPTSCDQILVNPPFCSQIPFPVKIFAFFSHSSPYFGEITDTKSTLPDPDARQRCKASENIQGTNCIALFFAVISVHWQHELAQSLLLSCLWIQVKLQLYVTSVQLRQYSCMWAEEICRGGHASHLRLTSEAIENMGGHFGASSYAHTQSASHAYRIF